MMRSLLVWVASIKLRDAQKYENILESILLSYVEEKMLLNWIYHQDNELKHHTC